MGGPAAQIQVPLYRHELRRPAVVSMSLGDREGFFFFSEKESLASQPLRLHTESHQRIYFSPNFI